MTKEQIDRINQLARKAKQSRLTDEEKAEQQALRTQYIQSIRADLRQTLDNVSIVDENGNERKLEKHEMLRSSKNLKQF